MSVAERISHLELDCTDLGKSVDFYTRAVGLELLSEVPGAQATLRAPPLRDRLNPLPAL